MVGALWKDYGSADAVEAPQSLEEKYMARGERISALKAEVKRLKEAGPDGAAKSSAGDEVAKLKAAIAAKDRRIAELEAENAFLAGDSPADAVALAAPEPKISGAAKPWLALGLSRAAYYRQKKTP